MRNDFPKIHRAIFGDVSGAHNLIEANPDAPQALLALLASRYTDRLLPTEVPWKPYICGFPLGGHYILTRTFPVKASRGGMVQTHALIIPFSPSWNSFFLEDFLSLLPENPGKYDIGALSAIAPADSSQSAPPMPAGYPSLVRALLHAQTPVWLDQDRFEQVVCFLWRMLWPSMRQELRFRVCAEPSDLQDFPATLVCVPKALGIHWSAKHFIDQSTHALVQPTLAEASLLGLPEGEQLVELREKLHFTGTQITGLKRLEQYLTMTQVGTPDSIRVATRLLNAMSPNSYELQDEKSRLLQRLHCVTVDGNEDDTLGLRNLELSGFLNPETFIEESVYGWLSSHADESGNGLRLAQETFIRSHPWKTAATNSFRRLFAEWTAKWARSLWNWWEVDHQLIKPLFGLLPRSNPNCEFDLVSSLPEALSENTLDMALSVAQENSWNLLHAALLTKILGITIAEKILRQFQREGHSSIRPGLDLLLRSFKPADILDAALKIEEVNLIEIAASVVTSNLTLMSGLNPTKATWRSIWTSVVRAGCDVFEGVTDPTVSAHMLLDELINGASIDEDLLKKISLDPRSGLVTYEKRRELWARLPSFLIKDAIQKTAGEFLNNLNSNSSAGQQLVEHALAMAIVVLWRSNPQSVTFPMLLRLFDLFPDLLDENDLILWIRSTSPAISTIEARSLGQYVAQNKFSRSAKELLKLVKNGRNDFEISVHECTSLLDIIDRVYLTLFTSGPAVGEDDFWEFWLELSVRFYPTGVQQNNIWGRSGGDISYVNPGPGRDQWGHALHLLRNGGAVSTITIAGLFHQMRNDFYNNPDLQMLESVYLDKLR